MVAGGMGGVAGGWAGGWAGGCVGVTMQACQVGCVAQAWNMSLHHATTLALKYATILLPTASMLQASTII